MAFPLADGPGYAFIRLQALSVGWRTVSAPIPNAKTEISNRHHRLVYATQSLQALISNH
jgi:hypothetical protein